MYNSQNGVLGRRMNPKFVHGHILLFVLAGKVDGVGTLTTSFLDRKLSVFLTFLSIQKSIIVLVAFPPALPWLCSSYE